MTQRTWAVRGRVLDLSARALVMGIVNVTPDSFSDGGKFPSPDAAVAHGVELLRQGADILDIGGESSRPGAAPVPVAEELARVLPVVQALARDTNAVLSVDTTKPEVADRALAAGAHIVNDITALRDPALAEAVRRHEAGVVLMHMRGEPATMQASPEYADVAREVREFLQARLQATADLGIDVGRTAVDPGIGFGKTAQHNLELLARLGELGALGRPVVLGVSRKRFLGAITGRAMEERDAASLACVCHALAHDTAQVVRVHDVAPARDAVLVMAALRAASLPA
jgi:dihydropteroate synthase